MADIGQEFISSYSGFPSFFKAPIITPDDITEGRVVIAGVPLDRGDQHGAQGRQVRPPRHQRGFL